MNSDLVFINNDRFQIIRGKKFYEFVPLWLCGSINLDGYKFGYYDPTKTEYPEDNPKYYMLICIDNLGDSFSIGKWKTKEELLDWLENPYVFGLYDRNNNLIEIAPMEYEARMVMFIDGGKTIQSSKKLYSDTVLDYNFAKENYHLLFR